MKRIWLDCAFDIKATSDDGRIVGHGAVFGNVDLGFDRIEPGAFKETLKDIGAEPIPMLWQHHSWEPIGVWDDMREDRKGLVVEGQINLDVERGREARSLVRQGAVKGLSIGYWPRDFSYEDDVRVLEKVDLHEVSLATFPMNPEARVAGIKNMTRKELESGLRETLGLSRHLASRVGYAVAKELEHADRRDSRDEHDDALRTLKQLKELFT